MLKRESGGIFRFFKEEKIQAPPINFSFLLKACRYIKKINCTIKTQTRLSALLKKIDILTKDYFLGKTKQSLHN